MRIVILGAGPAGLYLAYLLKRRRPDCSIEIFEQNPAGATFGFGIAFSERALEFLNRDDPETYAALRPALETWSDSLVVLNGVEIRIDGIGYAGIGRLRLLEILTARARSVGIEPHYGKRLESIDGLAADLIVGADGVNSVVRQAHAAEFGAAVDHFANRFAWFGTPRRFEALSHTFLETPHGAFNAHHHRHAPNESTFVVEADEATFFRAGLDKMDAEQSRAFCAGIFSRTLEDAPLVSNASIWRRFPKIRNARWSAGNRVLLGDALHTAHFSIGSGTRLAMEDAIALAKALAEESGVEAALAAYEATRKIGRAHV